MGFETWPVIQGRGGGGGGCSPAPWAQPKLSTLWGGGGAQGTAGSTKYTTWRNWMVHRVGRWRCSGGVANFTPKGGSQLDTRGLGPTYKQRPPQHQRQPQQANQWAPLARKRRKTHQPRGSTSNNAPAHLIQGIKGDCPGPCKESNRQPQQHQPQPQQTKYWAPRTHK